MEKIIYTLDSNFNISTTWLLSSLIIAIVIYLLFILLMDKLKIKTNNKVNLLVFTIPLILFLSLQILYNYQKYKIYKNIFKKRQYKIAKGIIKNYQPIEKGLKGVESFEVNGIKFAFSPAYSFGGFTKIGVLKNGECVEIYFIDNKNTPKDKIFRDIKYIILQIKVKESC